MRSPSVSLAKTLMACWPSSMKSDDLALGEVFCHASYTQSSPEDQDRIKLQSAAYRYEYEEQACSIDRYFPLIGPELEGKSVLDLGCFTGGRLVFWKKRYKLAKATGIDIVPAYIEAAQLFAQRKKVEAEFHTSFGENLPFAANCFDFVISLDVFEHVRNLEKVLQECLRVLTPGGKLLAVMPQFFQPLEAHLGPVTKMPALHWFFEGQTLTTARYQIEQARGNAASWYALKTPILQDWERLPTLNGLTVRRFRSLIQRDSQWKLEYWSRDPILSDGRRSRQLVFRLLRLLFFLPARLPFLEELFLGRICCILEKRP